MAYSNAQKLAASGVPWPVAKQLGAEIDTGPSALPWANVTGTQPGVEDAVAAKTQIAALSGSSTAAEIVTALKA